MPNLLFLAMRAQPTHIIATTLKMTWTKCKMAKVFRYQMMETNHASNRSGVSCAPSESRIKLKVVILQEQQEEVTNRNASFVPQGLDCMGCHGPPESKSRPWQGRGK